MDVWCRFGRRQRGRDLSKEHFRGVVYFEVVSIDEEVVTVVYSFALVGELDVGHFELFLM